MALGAMLGFSALLNLDYKKLFSSVPPSKGVTYDY